MKRTILIPTDFSAESLGLVEHAIAGQENDEIDIVLTHCMFLPDAITDLLYFSKIETIRSLRNPAFNRACRAIRNRYSNGNILIRTELFTGLNQAAFNNFIDGNDIDEAVIPSLYTPRLNLENSFNPMPFIRKSRLKITEVTIENEVATDAAQHFADLPKHYIRA